MTENEVCVGDVFEGGELRLQVSQPRQPCWKLARRWRIKDLALPVERTGRTGWYLRVLSGGHVQPGMTLALVERPASQWTIAIANEIMHHNKSDAVAARELAACPGLSASWQQSLTRRAAGGASDVCTRLGESQLTHREQIPSPAVEVPRERSRASRSKPFPAS